MNRRTFVRLLGCSAPAALLLSGCRGKQYAHILEDDDENMVGSHGAGAATYDPIVAEAVEKVLSREAAGFQQVAFNDNAVQPKRVCFVGIENASAEEIGDFREQLFEIIDEKITNSSLFVTLSRRYVDSGLREAGLHMTQLFQKDAQRHFQGVMESQGQPFDYLLFAKITSGTTRSNDDYQRDYLLTLELVNIHSGVQSKSSAKLRKGYHRTALGRAKHY